MSQIALQGDPSGTGTVSVVAPNTNTNRTITLPDASTTMVGTDTAQAVTNKSALIVNSNGTGVGYGTGAGGSVTQQTSKSTSVTLNTLSGQITMNNAALAANARVTFLLNNTTIANGDVIVTCIGGAFSGYSVEARNNQNGTSLITVFNYSAGSLSEAVVINFAIIKGATS